MSGTDTTEIHELLVAPEDAGQRLDVHISKALEIPRTLAKSLCKDSMVEVNGRIVTKPLKLQVGDKLHVTIPPQADPLEIRVIAVEDLKIIADEDDYVVIDKPVGVAAHPSPGWVGPTVVGALMAEGYNISTSGASERQGIVHRLDVGTSGLMVVAKSERAYTALKRAFKERTPKKVYHAVVQGLPDPLEGTIDAPIGRHPGHDWKFAVLEGGRDSVTHYEMLEAFGRASLVEVQLETGRTHQIRVHFSAFGHPCVGDQTYGADPKFSAALGLTRQWLHAKRLGFNHPVTDQWVEYESEYPHDLSGALELLREGTY
ncbi:RNA pseudouridine synthase [Arthrobacter sp. MYb211]|uniref:RluA family pseudouridine synthase n=1 Tax=Micrococcaceae TaxID=1268 RepID=UPI000CFC40DF|nr:MULTISPECIES: RluA family pseudouridine synthase [unclassified Arthrobacter]PRA01471.1 RNA pseudouridine synthase [Arthrobacter sp. MYb224]PRA06337.1 RNA pseudouridine synthase [Arthrobacter sp. MYb229]PRA12725.1 RNA pseudouridine synthase [Arthrobacter sp. MYb221]PRB53239.1 RNA pseudouridine synthase [Arthrobacter sp. MYb216]PRC09753.1 RNA pseudouridine synthase [Arthrobacter sp. MYb211]